MGSERQDLSLETGKMGRLKFLFVVACLLSCASFALAAGADPAAIDAETISTEKKSALAEQYLANMRSSLKKALALEEKAEGTTDILQVNCIKDNRQSIEGLLKIATQAETSLNEAISRKDEELINHEFTKISIAAVRVEGFNVTMSGCVGEASQYTGQTTVDTDIDEEIRSDNPAEDSSKLGFPSVFATNPSASTRPPAVSGSK